MAEITVARALSKLKIAKARIANDTKIVMDYAGMHTKQLSKLSAEKELGRNQKEAATKVYAALQSIGSLQSYIVTVMTEIQQSNLNTEINSEVFGKLSVAAALTLSTTLKNSYELLQAAARKAATAADMSAAQYNAVLPNRITDSLDSTTLEALLAKPLFLIKPEDVETIDKNVLSVREELNELINGSNAVTTINIPDIQLL